MPATYKRVPRSVPSSERTGVITDVEAGDEIDIKSILGRAAKRIKIIPSADTDTIEIRLNNKVNMPVTYTAPGVGESGHESPNSVTIVSKGAHYPLYELTGSVEYYTEEGLSVSFIQVESADNAFAIYCW